MLYDAIAASNGFYAQPVDPAVRSLMNVPFTIPSNADLEKTFVSEAAKQGMVRPRAHHRNPHMLLRLPHLMHAPCCVWC